MKNTLFIIFIAFSNALLAQNVAIELSRENILINHIDNPIIVTVENLDCNQIYIYSKDAQIQQTNCKANIRPNGDKKTVSIEVFKINETDTILLDKKNFRTRSIKPKANFFGHGNGDLKLGVFKNNLNNAKLSAFSEYICVKFEIYNSKMLVIRENKIVGLAQNSNETFSETTKALIQKIKTGDEVYFLDLKCKIMDTFMDLESLKFKIID